jgi:hypothetical protein
MTGASFCRWTSCFDRCAAQRIILILDKKLWKDFRVRIAPDEAAAAANNVVVASSVSFHFHVLT